MSTVTGFVLGVAAAATLTVLYGPQVADSLHQAAEIYPTAGKLTAPTAPTVPTAAQVAAAAEQQPAASEPVPPAAAQTTVEQRWAAFAAQAATRVPAGEFPWRECFARAAATHELPEPLLLAIASGESSFDAAARSDKDAIGLMQIRWPDTSRHLGVLREADLYDPCTNVDAGARYLVELGEQFDGNLHLMLAAYNYGPGRIRAGQAVPDGAHWYSQYIYRHLQQVLGKPLAASSEVPRPRPVPGVNHRVLMRFDGPQRAKDFMAFITSRFPALELQQRSRTPGQHEVVLLYRDDSERDRVLSLLNDAGIATEQLQPNSKHYL